MHGLATWLQRACRACSSLCARYPPSLSFLPAQVGKDPRSRLLCEPALELVHDHLVGRPDPIDVGSGPCSERLERYSSREGGCLVAHHMWSSRGRSLTFVAAIGRIPPGLASVSAEHRHGIKSKAARQPPAAAVPCLAG